MSDVSKLLFIATILCTIISPSMLFSQEPSPVETGDVEKVHDSQLAAPTSILIMRPELDSLRTMAAAIVARNKHIRIQEPEAASVEPTQIEAELWLLSEEVPDELVEKLIEDIARLGIVRFQLLLPFNADHSTVVIRTPAGTSQTAIKDLQTNLALPDGFKLDIRIRDNEPSPSVTPPQSIQSQITQLEVALAVQKLQLGVEHPTIKSLEERIAVLRKTEESEPKPPVTVLPLRHAKAMDVAEKFKQLDLGPVDAIVVDERTNSLMIRGTERQIKEIEQLIEVLDAEVSPTDHGEAAEATTPAAGPTAGGSSPLGRGGFEGRSPFGGNEPGKQMANEAGLPELVTVKVTASKAAWQHPELKPLLDDLGGLDFPVEGASEPAVAAAFITVPAEFSRKEWITLTSHLLDAGGVRVFFVDRKPDNKVTELTIFVRATSDETGKVGFHAESTQAIRTQLEKLPNLDVKFIAVAGDVSQLVRFNDEQDSLAAAEIKAYSLQHVAAQEAQRVIVELFGHDGTAISAEQKSNTLLVRSEPGRMAEIEAILMRLDEKAAAEHKDATTAEPQTKAPSSRLSDLYGGSSLPAETPIAEYRRRLKDLEKPVLELAEKVRTAETSLGKEHPEYQKLLADLRALVQQTFAARQEIQRAELAEFTRRLERMKQAIETREKIAYKIVDRRIEELMHPETDWNAFSSLPRADSRSAVASSPLPSGTDSANGQLISLLGTWEVEELNIKSAGIDISAVAPKPRLTVTENHFVVPMDGGITVTMKYELVAGDPLRVNLTFDGSNAQTFGVIKYTDDSFWLCFREPADIGEPGLTENDRPVDFLPGEQNYFLKCQRTLPVNQPEVGTFLDLERTPPIAITRTYHVGNYVTATFFEQAIGTQRTAASLDAAAEKIRQKAEELITQVSSHSKPAAISFDSARLQLVVSHTAEGHSALGEMFATLKLPMQQELTFSRCEVNEQIYTAFKDSPIWTAFDEFRNEVEDGGWIGVRKKEFATWFERVLKEAPAGEDFGQPRSLVLTAGVPYQFDAGEIRVALTARINPASQKPELRIDYADLSGRPSGTRMINNLEDLAVYVPSSEGSITFLVHQSAQGGSFPRRDSLQKQDSASLKPIDMAPEVTKEEPRLVQIRLTSGVEGNGTTVSCSVGVPIEFYVDEGKDPGPYQLTFERNGSNENSQAWLNNNAVPVEFLSDDQERAAAGQLVTKAIYLNSDTGAVETISGHNLEAGVDPTSVAAEKGTVIGGVRISRVVAGLSPGGERVTISLEAYELDPKDESTVSLLDPGKPVSESIERDVKALLEAKKIKRLVNANVQAVIGKETEVVSGGEAPVNPASIDDGLVKFGTILTMTPSETNGVPGIVATVRIVDRRGIEKAKSGVSVDAKEYHLADHSLSYGDRGKLFGPFEKSADRAVIIRLRMSKDDQKASIPDSPK